MTPRAAARALRRRAATELAVLAVLTGLYLGMLPGRPPGLDAAMALVGLGLVGVVARDARERFWTPPAEAAPVRLRRSAIRLAGLTLPALAAFALYGAWDAWSVRGAWADVAARLASPGLGVALVLYVPWALLQQALFQFYLLGRWRALWPSATPGLLAGWNGLAFGLVHWPDMGVVWLATAGGIAWSYVYLRDRCLLPIALSHALAGATFFYWVRGTDLLASVLR